MSFFNLGARATSREAVYFSKERRIPHTEYSPNLQLIRSSEVDIFKGAPGSTTSPKAITRSHVKAPAAPAGQVARNVPRQPAIAHSPTLISNGDEQLKATYKTAIANLENQVRDARLKARLAEQALRKRGTLRFVLLTTLAVAGIWAIQQQHNYDMASTRNLVERLVAQRAAMTSARGEGDDNKRREEVRNAMKQEVRYQAGTKTSGWKSWLWAQPNV
ncbi:hypothetical protein MMC10_006442 [Thelotrema lepadinum]|nr:hypothetical protein [Thelotrema lepadinum]